MFSTAAIFRLFLGSETWAINMSDALYTLLFICLFVYTELRRPQFLLIYFYFSTSADCLSPSFFSLSTSQVQNAHNNTYKYT